MKENTIKIDGNNNIVIQDSTNGNITINVENSAELMAFLKTATDSLKQELLSLLQKQTLQVFENAKNCVAGSIQAGGNVHIGDIINLPTKTKLPKYLTNEIPLLAEDKIVGRANDLIELHQLLFDNKQVVVVNGLGGIGKTTLVQVYIHKYMEEYQHIAWISQKSDNIFLDFASATDLVQNLEIGKEHTDPKSIFNEMVRKLSGVETMPNLLVIDNADDSLEQIRHSLPKQPQWHILITSRNKLNGFTMKIIDFLSPEDALLLFKTHYTRKELSDTQIAELIKIIDNHTLTIEILAKTAMLQHYDFETLRNAISTDAKAGVKINRPDTGKIEKITTFLCSIFGMSKLSENELWLLKQFTCLPAEFLNYDLLTQLIHKNEPKKRFLEIFKKKNPIIEFKLAETLEELTQKAWLLKNPETDSFKMHFIVSEVVKKQKLIEMGELAFIIKAVTGKLHLDQNKDNPVDKFQWIPYGVSLLDTIEIKENRSREFENITSVLQNELALALKGLGDHDGAKKLLEKVIMTNGKNFGVNHPATLVGYSNLALVLQETGDYASAKKLLEKAITTCKKNFGEYHLTTAVSYSNLSTVLHSLGDFDGAKKMTEKAIKTYEKNFGVDHPSTTDCYSNLATTLHSLGDYESAKKFAEKAMKSDEKNFGVDHPSTAVSYSNLASTLQALGDYEGAKKFAEKAMKSDEKNFGVDHPSTAVSYSNLASVLHSLGDFDGAKKLSEKAIKSYEQNFGMDHPKTAVCYYNLATVLYSLGDYVGAKKLLENSIKSDEKNLGVGHPSTTVKYSYLGLVLKALGDYDGAKKLLEKAMKSNEKNFGMDHPSTAVSYSNLANTLHALGDYDGAKKLLEKAVKSNEKNFGEEHPSTARSYSKLAWVLQDLGDYAGAKQLLEKAVLSDEKNFGVEHPSTAQSYSKLALVLQDLGDYDDAKQLLEKAIKINEKNFGVNHPITAVTYSQLGHGYRDTKQYEKAYELYNKAFQISLKNLGELHPTIAVRKKNLGLALIGLGEKEKALEMFQSAYEIRLKLLSAEHPDTIQVKEYIELYKFS